MGSPAKPGDGASARAAAARGRPYRLPVDPTPTHETRPSFPERVAWLLGVSRLYAHDPTLATRAPFLARLKDLGITVDATRLSRWEAGQATVSAEVLSAYEQVLELTPGSLSIGVLGLTRAIDPPTQRSSPPHVDPATAHARLDEAFERVLDGSATGQEWLSLCRLVTQHPQLYLLQSTWAEVTDLLARHLCRSRGLDFLARFEALRMLVAHPTSRRHAVRAIGSLVTNAATEFAIHPLSLLQEVDDAQAIDLLLRLLQGGPSYLRYGAAWALAGSQLRGNLSDELTEHLEAATVDLLQRSRTPIQRIDSLALYAAMPLPSRERLNLHPIDGPSTQALGHVARSGEIAPAGDARQHAARISEAAQARMESPRRLEDDQMLKRLVREILFHALPHRRYQAGLLLAVSPYRGVVADELVALTRTGDETITVMALTALHLLAEPRHRGELWERATQDRRASVRSAAMVTLAQVAETLTADEIATLCDAIITSRVADPTITLYTLGLAGAAEQAMTTLPADHPDRDLLAWWLANPPIADAVMV